MKQILLLIILALLTACGAAPGNDCVEGVTQECLCVGGGTGVQTCRPGGNAWGECLGCAVPGDGGGDVARAEDRVEGGDGESDHGGTQPDGGCTPACAGACGDDGCGGSCGACADGWSCQAGGCVEDPCLPDCDGKLCGDDGCGGSCGTCDDGLICVLWQCELLCEPDCAEKECGDDGCGGLCNDCLDIVYDDGTTETAYGYSTQPEFDPQRIACVVRFDLPQAGMRLTRFTAGWMWGLYNLQIPFELAYLPGDAMECEEGTEQSWFNEYCQTTPDLLVSIGDFLPLEPFEPMGADLLGEVVLPTATVYLAAIFAVDEYPVFVCPVDESGDGSLAYMMPQFEKTRGLVVGGASFDQKESNHGVIPFSIRVETPN
jgi:hypothetical protein